MRVWRDPYRGLRRVESTHLPCPPSNPRASSSATFVRRSSVERGLDKNPLEVMIAALYTADAVLMPPNVPTASGRSEIQAFLETFPPVSQFELQQITVDGSEDLAFVHGTYTMTLVMPDGTAVPDTGKYLEIRRRQSDGRWLLTHDMFSSDSPEPEM